jgi:formate dehydrogenase iron-sulfur subunit
MQSLDVQDRSATTTATPQVRGAVQEVAKLIDISKCIGCKACQVACMQWNDLRDDIGTNVGVYDNPTDLTDQSWTVMRFAEVARDDGSMEWLIRKDGCMHCEDPGCLKACPAPGAIVKYANGIVDFISSNCIGCGYCIAGCPFDIPRISKKDNKAYKCSLCSDRVAVGQAPACVKTCPTGALQFGSKVDMVARGEKRVHDLQERGFQKAALYDPQGVGGTHVMYVLQHGDKPQLYSNLPADPTISPWVSMWKGATKPLAALVLGVAALGAFFHYVVRGPKEVDEREEHEEERHGDAR